MINFEKFTLNNGLRVLVHEDDSTPLAVVNIMYDVGARDENEQKTGFAHLFEHLMFEGSKNIPNFDAPLERAGGTSNAFTNNDITNYYDTLPAANLETAFWLESDRMWMLNIDEENLEVQRKVVCEEFKEHYLNQPYGDIWHKLSDLSYKVHPYKWPTIGKELKHVEDATLQDVQQFFSTYYRPNNAVMVVSGSVKTSDIEKLTEKWFGDIPAGKIPQRNLPVEPMQNSARTMKAHADVPLNAIYKTYHMGPRMSDSYYALDLATDILSNGNSARLHTALVKDNPLFGDVDAYVSGTSDAGLVVVEGRLMPGVSMEEADQALTAEIDKIANGTVTNEELQKVKNKHESYTVFSEVNLLNRSINLAFHELNGDANGINHELDHYAAVTVESLNSIAADTFRTDNSNTLFYHANTPEA